MNRLLTLAAAVLLFATSTAAAPVGTRQSNTYRGTLNEGQNGQLELTLYAGTTYTYSGACDMYCHDLDFTLYRWVRGYNGRAGYWTYVVSDTQPDDTPGVWVRPDYNATYRLVITMANCNDDPCNYTVGVSW